MLYNLNNKKQFPKFHLYRTGEGVNLFCKSPITVDDFLLIRGEVYSLGKGKGMAVESNKRTPEGYYYQEYTIHKL